MNIPHRTSLSFALLAVAYSAGVLYDLLFVQQQPQLQIVLGLCIAAALGGVVLLTPFSVQQLQAALFSAWPLHLFTAAFFWVSLAYHAGDGLNQIVFYTVFAYATYVIVPLVLVADRRMFEAFVRLVALSSALLSIPSLWGATGHESFLGVPMSLKFAYAQFSGIIASGGVFEHLEGHAFQMALGTLCSWYVLRSSGRNLLYLGCFGLTLLGLVISQGRAAILGMCLVVLLQLLPQLFRRSQLIFLATLGCLLAFPFLILPQLAVIPGVEGYFRFERGMSGREEAWRYAISAAAERPWTGYGFMASTRLTEAERKTLRKSGFSGAGTTFHNTFISKTVDLGIIATAFYALLYLLPLKRICLPASDPVTQEFLRSMLIVVLAASLFRDYNIGGVRSTTMLGTIFLGLGGLWNMIAQWGWGRPPEPAEPWPAADTIR